MRDWLIDCAKKWDTLGASKNAFYKFFFGKISTQSNFNEAYPSQNYDVWKGLLDSQFPRPVCSLFQIQFILSVCIEESTPHLSTFQQYCIFRHVVVTGTLSWLVLVFTNFGAFIKYLAECKVTSQIPVTTTGRKIQITQLIAEKWTPVICTL